MVVGYTLKQKLLGRMHAKAAPTSFSTFRQRERMTLQTSCGAERVKSKLKTYMFVRAFH